ncbi:unnamed protein product [Schistosoma margrebowiei]|uniref:Uncharacterized protein n=1 Tax=Schistosoma margrebowiei TaxID=48269 RepID=A0A183M4M6_9TREM|nr:unnamed protein product [Schistosoma margrebowiei]
MKTSISDGKHGIHWTARMQLNYLDFEDDLVFPSHTQQQTQENTTGIAAASAAVGLNIHKRKSKVLRYNTTCTNRITHGGEDLEDVKTFTYLGSIIDEHGRFDADVKVRIGKARPTYLQLRNIWNSQQPTQSQNFQYKCQDSFTVCCRNLENYEGHHPEDTSVPQQLSTQNNPDPFARNYQQQPTLGENKPDSSGGRNQEEETVDVDRTHIEEIILLCHKIRPHMES